MAYQVLGEDGQPIDAHAEVDPLGITCIAVEVWGNGTECRLWARSSIAASANNGRSHSRRSSVRRQQPSPGNSGPRPHYSIEQELDRGDDSMRSVLDVGRGTLRKSEYPPRGDLPTASSQGADALRAHRDVQILAEQLAGPGGSVRPLG